ncbi:MAG: polymerase, sigma-24 subunit, subfamily [Chitinophagaceae bacterium]|nr:polymerase, sigma-24 subunit, subfamily [Chitinophagaceae bacterium]
MEVGKSGKGFTLDLYLNIEQTQYSSFIPLPLLKIKILSCILNNWQSTITRLFTMDSLELITLLRHNKEKGISCLYDKYAPALNGIIVRIVKSEKKSEEVLQRTFLKITHAIEHFDEEKCSLFTWLSRMARQEAIEASTTERENGVPYPSAQEQDKRMAAISKECKEVLDHIYLLGYTPLETSAKLNLPLDTVKTRLRSAIFQLRETLSHDRPSLLSKALFIIFSLPILS